MAVFATVPLRSQIAPDTYWVQFTDKNNSEFSIDRPWEFLSSRAVERRIGQNISITESDLPVNKVYIDSLQSLGAKIHNVSKWLNGAVIITSDSALLETISNLSFVKGSLTYNNSNNIIKSNIDKFPEFPESTIDYGYSESQVKMLNGYSLHELDYNGQGMLIAVLDAGFTNARHIESLQHLWDNNKIIAWNDFVKDGNDMFDVHTHGTVVFSIIGGYIPNVLYGTATEADFILVRTENGASEYLVEEYNWLSGAEYVDSIGADIINSSLGYSVFQNPAQDHSYSDLDGRTTPISVAANMAASKGILVVTSAGNEGNNSWHYITAPADADSILSIGAVKSNRTIADFSSRGPTYDKRIKPDVSAQGVTTYGQVSGGNITTCTGTSCSSPVIAGMAACLWQSRPDATTMQIKQAIIEASDRFAWPDTIYGYGIPDFIIAQNILDSISPPVNDLSQIYLAPNPVEDYALLVTTLPWLNNTELGEVNFYDLNGRLLIRTYKYFNKGITMHTLDEALDLEDGYYTIRIAIQNRFYKIPFIKL